MSEDQESNDEWEYYDDSTTLTDLWQNLKDECLEDDPLNFWLNKSPLKGLKYAVHDYWRLKVPLILAPGFGHTSVDQPICLEKYTNSLIQPLEGFICGNGSTREIFEKLAANDSAPAICGRAIDAGLAVYGCRDCGQDQTCVMCPDCFMHSEHKNHNYIMSTTDGNGFCDCGDSEAFTKFHMCSIHEELARNEVTAQQVLDTFPQDLRSRSLELLKIIIDYIIAMPELDSMRYDWRVGEKEKETWPDLRYIFDHSTHCLLLINDDSHSYKEVTTVIKSVLRYSDKKAMDLTELVDKEGRAIIKVGSWEECNKAREKIQRVSGRDGSPLKALVFGTFIAAHQIFAIKLCSWLVSDLFPKCSGFRALFYDVLCMKSHHGSSFLEQILVKSGSVWKDVRRKWLELLAEVTLKSPENKTHVGELYLNSYSRIMYDFVADDQELDVSIVNLTVQIFTTPTVAHHLMEKMSALEVMVQYFAQVFENEARITSDGQLDLTEWLEDRQYDFKRCAHILTDIQYILGVPPTKKWSPDLRKNFVSGTKALVDLITKLQLADRHVRQQGAHVVYESRNWANIFTLTSHFMGMASLITNWCKMDTAALTPIFNHILEKLSVQDEKPLKKVVLEMLSEREEYEVVNFDAGTEACSIHVPLQQFLAMLLTCFDHVPGMTDIILERIQLHDNLMHIIDPVITVLTVLAQIKCGMWKRNGITMVEGSYYIYHDPRITPHNKINDLRLLQTACSISSDPGLVIATLMDRMQLTRWASETAEQDLPEEAMHVADEFLHLVIAILCERMSPEVSAVSVRDELKYRLTHILLSGELSHSEVMANIHREDSSKFDSIIEEVLNEIADLVSSRKVTTKKVYQLKKEVKNGINPFFYYYTRNQRDEVDAGFTSEEKMEFINKPPRNTWPKLNHMFANLPKISRSWPVLIVIYTILKRWETAGDATSIMMKHLHKALWIINMGFIDDAALGDGGFAKAFESCNFASMLAKIKPPPELKELLGHTIKQASKLCSSAMESLSNQEHPALDTDRKRRAQAAASCKAKVMAQMNQMQKKFAKTYESELSKMDTSNAPEEEDMSSGASYVKAVKAIGIGRFVPDSKHCSYTCILCQEDEADDSISSLVFATYVVNTSVMSQTCPIDPELTGKSVSPGTLPSSLTHGPTVTSCGHVMHAKCYQAMFDNLVKQHQDNLRSNFNVNNQEYLCPICQRLSNSVLPVSPSLNKFYRSVLPAGMSFSQWTKEMMSILVDDSDYQDFASPNPNMADEMTQIVLRESVDFSQLMVAPFGQTLSEMTSNFALNCMLNSRVKEFPDDCRSLHMCFQAAAMNLHLCQSPERPEDDFAHLFQPMLARDEEVLKSLVRLCINFPHTKDSLRRTLQSNGLWVLSTCFNPESCRTFLELDVLNLLIILSGSIPVLVKQSGLFSQDHHAVRLCAIIYLCQIMAGLQPSSSDCHNDSEEPEVQKFAKWVSESFGSSDKVKIKATQVRQAMIRFLRCASVFYHCATDVPLPVLEDVNEKSIYATLSEYLSLPSTLTELINDGDTFDCLNRLLQNGKLKTVSCPSMPAQKRSLIELPEDYTDLLSKVTTYECPNKAVISGKSKSVALCLICGELICFESYCCRGEINGLKSGGCTIHAKKCSGDVGIFLKLSSCQITVLSGVFNGGLCPAPYVDRFGENDVELRRGNPLKLDKAQYQKIIKMWQQNDTHAFIAKSRHVFRNLDLMWNMI